jgi:hypothetical protein
MLDLGTGWEIWGVKASLLLVTLVSGIIAVLVRLMTHDSGKLAHIDGMAGDEGED